jgi:hypothetical protein
MQLVISGKQSCVETEYILLPFILWTQRQWITLRCLGQPTLLSFTGSKRQGVHDHVLSNKFRHVTFLVERVPVNLSVSGPIESGSRLHGNLVHFDPERSRWRPCSRVSAHSRLPFGGLRENTCVCQSYQSTASTDTFRSPAPDSQWSCTVNTPVSFSSSTMPKWHRVVGTMTRVTGTKTVPSRPLPINAVLPCLRQYFDNV